MPLNYKLLRNLGTTPERLCEVFTAKPAQPGDPESARLDWEVRKKIEDMVSGRIDESILHSLRNSHLFGAVDLAWDSATITRRTIPLVLYAQRRINFEQCIKALADLNCKDEYVRTDPDSKKQFVELPKFHDVNVNILRSVITRRVAAQSARFTNLYPFFRYETRGTSEEDKLIGDLVSQRMDIMADQYGFREAQIQWIRDMLLYPYSVVFPVSVWDHESEWVSDDVDVAPEFQTSGDSPQNVRVVRQGVPLISPHPSRVFYDTSHPLQSINSDTGCQWFGFWDVVRFSSIEDNLDYFNRAEVGFSPDSSSWFHSYSNYFSQYYTTVSPPLSQDSLSGYNDRKTQCGKYVSNMRDNSVYLTHFYWKMVPAQYRIGKYPFAVWVHLTVANSSTVVAAEIMPDCPGAVFTFNTSSQRLNNLSMAHELLPWQDQLSNLQTQLLECAKRDLFGVAMLNLDAFPASDENAQKALKQFREAFKSESFFTAVSLLEVSLIKLRELGVDLDNVFKVIRQPPNTQINVLLQAISQCLSMTERVLALSPQEQAQLSPRETSATEIQVIAGTTENLYQMISDSVDAGRSALKRYLYNAYISCSDDEVKLPVMNRYRITTAAKAGFSVQDATPPAPGTDRMHFVAVGSKKSLSTEFVFNSRDGSDRASNIQAAQTLTQMLGILMQPAVLAMLTKEKLADIINGIVRQSGAGTDILIEPPAGEEGMPVMAAQPPPAPVGPPATQAGPMGSEQVQIARQ